MVHYYAIRLLLCSVVGFSQLCLYAQSEDDTQSLRVKIDNIRSDQGTLVLCLTDNAEEFLKSCVETKVIPVNSQGSLQVLFEDIPTGRYAISIFHDTNENTELDKKIFGLPKEDFGFSNNPRLSFGPPTFDNCAFVHDKKGAVLTIDLRRIM